MMFIEIRVNDNLPFTKLGVHRTHPSGFPNKGEMCKYDIYKYSYDMEYNSSRAKIGNLEFPYGDGNLLTIEVLQYIQNL